MNLDLKILIETKIDPIFLNESKALPCDFSCSCDSHRNGEQTGKWSLESSLCLAWLTIISSTISDVSNSTIKKLLKASLLTLVW